VREPRKNIPASVHARLLAVAQGRREDFNLTLHGYVAERFLYRLGASRHKDRFVLKGAMLFSLWGGSLYRAADFTAAGELLRSFLGPIWRALADGRALSGTWPRGGPWTPPTAE